MNKVKVFDQIGMVKSNAPVNMQLVALSVNQDNKTTNYLTQSPITSISIQESADYSLNKSLSSDFLVSTLNDLAVQISIGGLHSFNTLCSSDKNKSEQQSVLDFYQKYKISTNTKTRITITIGNSNRVYKCVLVKMGYQLDSSARILGSMTYKLQFIGVVDSSGGKAQ